MGTDLSLATSSTVCEAGRRRNARDTTPPPGQHGLRGAIGAGRRNEGRQAGGRPPLADQRVEAVPILRRRQGPQLQTGMWDIRDHSVQYKDVIAILLNRNYGL